MSREDMERIREEFVRSAGHALDAGFDLLLLNLSHGYLLSSFISPLTNGRADEHGGSLPNRMRFPLEVFDAVRSVWPAERSLGVSLNGTDWARGGTEPEEAVASARMLKDRGCDLIRVVAGQTTARARPEYGRLFLGPFSDRIRNEAGIATMVGGNITTYDEVDTLLAAGRADLCQIDPVG
jgi:anthraniloyl-CoA monooxygenase